MARLSTHFGPHVGNLRIYLGIFSVGSGNFGVFDDFSAAFAGAYEVFGQSGKLALAIRLTDAKPQSTSGPCEITLNGAADKGATYTVSGNKLILTTKLNPTPVNVYISQGGTQFDGVSGHNLWIGP